VSFDSPVGGQQPRSLHQSRELMADFGPVAVFDAPLEKRPPMVGAR
jgi:hypothetical protein